MDAGEKSPSGEGIFPLVPPACVGSLLDTRWLYVPRRQRAAGWRDVSAACRATNWMHGTAFRRMGEGTTAASAARLARLRLEVQLDIEGAVLRWGTPPVGFSTQEAENKLRRGRGPYLTDPVVHTGPSPYSHDRVSLPQGTWDCPLLRDIASDAALKLLTDWKTRMLRPPVEVEELDASLGILPTYIDPVLKRQRRTYIRLIKRLLKLGMVLLSRSCRCQVGVFTVGKKSGDLRLILDCRRSNRRFRSPPGVELLTAEGWSRVEVELMSDGLADPLALGITDIENCFHRFKFGEEGLGSELSDYFHCPR